MARGPSKSDPFRISRYDLQMLANGMPPPTRVGLVDRKRVWMTPEPKLPTIHITFVPGTSMDDALALALREALSADDSNFYAIPESLKWAKESIYDFNGFPLKATKYFGGLGGPVLNYFILADRWEMTSCNGAIWYALHERNDMIGANFTKFGEKGLQPQLAPKNAITAELSFGDLVQGGDLIVQWRDRTIFFNPIIEQSRVRVRGKNPKKNEIRDYIASQAGNAEDAFAITVLAYHESGFRQFYDEGDYDLDIYRRWLQTWGYDYSAADIPGLPVVGPSGDPKQTFHGGFGIMQIDQPPTGPVTSDQIWDWRRNVDAGVATYQYYKMQTMQELQAIHRTYRAIDKTVPFFRPDQIRLHIWTKYNGGPKKQYWGWWDGRPEVRQWKPRRTRTPGEARAQAYANGLDALSYVIDGLHLCPSPHTARSLRKNFPLRQWIEPLSEWMPLDWCDSGGGCTCR